jgi:hypothetical protein
MAGVAAFTAKIALEAGNAMEATFASVRAGDRDGALYMAREATAKALLAKKAMSSHLHQAKDNDTVSSAVALGNIEDARLFAKAAMDVCRGHARRVADKGGGEAGKKAAETLAFLMVAATVLMDIKRGSVVETSLRKAAAAAERAAQSADEATKAGGAGNAHVDEAQAARQTAGEIARRALWAVREAQKH